MAADVAAVLKAFDDRQQLLAGAVWSVAAVCEPASACAVTQRRQQQEKQPGALMSMQQSSWEIMLPVCIARLWVVYIAV